MQHYSEIIFNSHQLRVSSMVSLLICESTCISGVVVNLIVFLAIDAIHLDLVELTSQILIK